LQVKSHKESVTTKSIMKPLDDLFGVGSKSVCQPSKTPLEKSFHKTDKDDLHYKSMKNKGEPLLLNDIDIMDEEEKEEDLRISQTEIVEEKKKPQNQVIEQFYEGKTNKNKFFAPKKEKISHNTEPIDLKKKIVIAKVNNAPK